MRPAGLLLTGGRSTRMGRDKATLRLPDGSTFSERLGARLASVCAPALEVGTGVSGLPSLLEDDPGSGPLAAVVAGWEALCAQPDPPPAVLVLACDMPLVEAPLLERLARWPEPGSVVPLLGMRPQWCCARYSRAALERARELFHGGRRDLAALAGRDELASRGDLAGRGELACGGPPAGAPPAGSGAGEVSTRFVEVEQLGGSATSLADADTPEQLSALGLDTLRR